MPVEKALVQKMAGCCTGFARFSGANFLHFRNGLSGCQSRRKDKYLFPKNFLEKPERKKKKEGEI
jgi:hypothetical protein